MVRDKTEKDEFENWVETDINNMSPCPMLNTLKNYGLLPNKNISSMIVYDALKKIKCDEFISYNLASIFKTNYSLAKDFNDIGKHNLIEHDVSMTREDDNLGDHIHFSKQRLNKMMSYSTDKKYLKLNELAEYFKYQKQQSEINNKELLFGNKQKFMSLAEQSVLCVLLRDNTGHIPLKWLEYFLTKEKLPFKHGFELKSLNILDIISVAGELFVHEYL